MSDEATKPAIITVVQVMLWGVAAALGVRAAVLTGGVFSRSADDNTAATIGVLVTVLAIAATAAILAVQIGTGKRLARTVTLGLTGAGAVLLLAVALSQPQSIGYLGAAVFLTIAILLMQDSPTEWCTK